MTSIFEMQRAKSTMDNDAVTRRQFERFLSTAEISSRFESSVKTLEDVIQLPLIIQDKLCVAGLI